MDDTLAPLRQQYPSFDPQAEFVEIDIPEEENAIEPRWSRKHFHFTFYRDAFKQMDRVTELMTRLGLACYAGTKTLYSVEQPPPSFAGTPEEQTFYNALDKTLSDAAVSRPSRRRVRRLIRVDGVDGATAWGGIA